MANNLEDTNLISNLDEKQLAYIRDHFTPDEILTIIEEKKLEKQKEELKKTDTYFEENREEEEEQKVELAEIKRENDPVEESFELKSSLPVKESNQEEDIQQNKEVKAESARQINTISSFLDSSLAKNFNTLYERMKIFAQRKTEDLDEEGLRLHTQEFDALRKEYIKLQDGKLSEKFEDAQSAGIKLSNLGHVSLNNEQLQVMKDIKKITDQMREIRALFDVKSQDLEQAKVRLDKKGLEQKSLTNENDSPLKSSSLSIPAPTLSAKAKKALALEEEYSYSPWN